MYLSTVILYALSATLERSSLQLKQYPCSPRVACTKLSTICCRVQRGKTRSTRCACGKKKKIPTKLRSLTLNVSNGEAIVNRSIAFCFSIKLYVCWFGLHWHILNY